MYEARDPYRTCEGLGCLAIGQSAAPGIGIRQHDSLPRMSIQARMENISNGSTRVTASENLSSADCASPRGPLRESVAGDLAGRAGDMKSQLYASECMTGGTPGVKNGRTEVRLLFPWDLWPWKAPSIRDMLACRCMAVRGTMWHHAMLCTTNQTRFAPTCLFPLFAALIVVAVAG